MPWKIVAKNSDEAEIFLYGVIGGYDDNWQRQSATYFINKIKDLGDISKITIRINSVGGDVFESQAIYSYLRTHKAEKIVRIDGLAASGASIVAMAGDRIIMPENAMMMIHNPSTIVWGTATDMRDVADMLDKVRDTLTAVYRGKTGLDASKLEQMMEDETWMTATDALELGFCDETEETLEMAACASGDGFALKTVAGETYIPKALSEKMPFAIQNIAKMEAPEKSPKNSAKPAEPQKTTREADTVADSVEIRTAAELEAAHSALVKEIRDSARAEGHENGIKAERDRLKLLDSLNAPGREKIIDMAKYVDPKSAQDVAVELLTADKTTQATEDRRTDASACDNALNPTVTTLSKGAKEDAAAEMVAQIINEKRGLAK